MGSRTLNLYNKQIISKEEIREWDSSLRELVGELISSKGSKKGILDNNIGGSLQNNSFEVATFGTMSNGKVTINTGKGLLRIEDGAQSYVDATLTTNNTSLVSAQKTTFFGWSGQQIDIPNFSSYTNETVYVGFIPVFSPLEKGLCSISSSGNQVTIVGGDFLKLRDQIFKNPTKIKFFKESNSSLPIATQSTVSNNEIYEVIEIVDSNNIVISGSLVDEDDVKMMIVGSYDLSVAGALSENYTYVKYDEYLLFSTNSGDFSDGFILCSLDFTSANTYTITDLRLSNLMNFVIPSNISYIDVVETLTAEKTFRDIVFGGIVNSLFSSSTLTISSLNKLLIPITTDFSQVYIVTGNPISTLTTVGLQGGWSTGDRFKLKISDYSDIVLNLGTGTYSGYSRVRINGKSSGQVTLKASSIYEFIADSDLSWIITNFEVPVIDSSWVRVTTITDSTSPTPVGIDTSSSAENLIYYRTIGNVTYIKLGYFNILTPPAYPLLFTIPASVTPTETTSVFQFELSPNTLRLYMDSAGTCRLYLSADSISAMFHVNFLND